MRALLILATAIAAAEPARAGERPRCPVYRLAAAPTIDGDVRNDPAWRAIPSLTGFRVLGRGYTVAKQSTARIGWTSKALFVAMVCEEPDMGLVRDKRKDGGQLWLDNGVEIFLQPPGSTSVLQLIANTLGSRVVGAGRDKVSMADWKAGVMKGKDFWSAEFEIPFACLGSGPSPGAKWRGAFCRNIWEYRSGGDKFTTWPALTACFREPESFADLELHRDTLSPAQAAEIALKLNMPYRQHLSRRIEELAESGRQYREPIAKAGVQALFAVEARELSLAWQRVGALADDSATAPLPEVRAFVAMASGLKRRSYELKYRFLMEELLAE